MNNLNLLHRLDHINTITFKIDEKSTPGIQGFFFISRDWPKLETALEKSLASPSRAGEKIRHNLVN